MCAVHYKKVMTKGEKNLKATKLFYLCFSLSDATNIKMTLWAWVFVDFIKDIMLLYKILIDKKNGYYFY